MSEFDTFADVEPDDTASTPISTGFHPLEESDEGEPGGPWEAAVSAQKQSSSDPEFSVESEESAEGQRVRRVTYRAAPLDLREARSARWADTVDLLCQQRPRYLVPFLSCALR
jgi:hypothetical protein